MPMLSEFGTIFLFILAAIALIVLMLTLAKIIRPSRPNEEKLTTYESGEDPVGNANIQFNVRFYVVAIVFLLFEVELIFLFPWATVFGQANLIAQTDGLWGWFSLIEMLIFVGMLALGLAYAWSKGYLDWVRPQPKIPQITTKVPAHLYQSVNDKYGTKINADKV
jgi:NADH-quinone oxidoreductase subunit A